MVDYNVKVETSWAYNNRQRYEALGYKFEGYRKKLFVFIKDLSPQANVRVPVNCDLCGAPYPTEFYNVTRNKRQVCEDCHGDYLRDELAYTYEEVKALVEGAGLLCYQAKKNTLQCLLLKLALLYVALKDIKIKQLFTIG